MLATGRYPQWCPRFLRYVDTRPNGEALKKCILSGPYKPTTVLVQAVEATDDSPVIPEHTTEAIERLQQGESLNIQDVKTNLFWEFGKFTSHDGETMKSYYTRFYKLMNEMIRNNLIVATMQINVQFLQQLQPEWSRFVTIVKQQHKLDEVSYHKLFDILTQYQKEVNELRAERLVRNANPLALATTAQANQDPYYQTSRDKDIQKNLALITKYFKKIYKPTNNNLRTSSNSKNKNVDTTPRYKNDDHSGQFRNHKTVNVAGAREKVGSLVVQQSGIQCFNCKEFGHFAKECRKPKRVKDSAYHKEKMLLHKQAKQGVPLQAEQYDWLADTDEEVDKHELEAHYNYMAKIQEVPTADSGPNSEPLEQNNFPLPVKKVATAKRKVKPLPGRFHCYQKRITFNPRLTFTFNSQQEMDQQYPTVAKIPLLDTRKFEQWCFRIQQYLQHEHYALWEVLEFGDSYAVPASSSSTTTTDTTSGETGKKSGRMVTLTTEDMQKKKNDVKARTTLLLSLPDEHQL
nr:hypothetical protein [Tanacetum cinerariifolium]